MKHSVYKIIIKKYREIKSRNCSPELVALFPDVPASTLEGIIFQEYQRKTKRSYYRLTATQNVASYYQRYQEYAQLHKECGFLLKLSDTVDLSPSLMARHILEQYYNDQQASRNSSDGKNSPDGKSKQQISEFLKDTSLIEDGQLAAEIRMCILADENYGPISDVIRRSIGEEYENKLKDELTKHGLAFVDEVLLREKGYDKTPDVKLEVPIAIEGRVVNWIESKASFGDEERHKEYLRDQYWSYCNRFGPGLVIYWLGFIEELNIHKEQGILIKDHIPSKITFIDPSILMKKGFCL